MKYSANTRRQTFLALGAGVLANALPAFAQPAKAPSGTLRSAIRRACLEGRRQSVH